MQRNYSAQSQITAERPDLRQGRVKKRRKSGAYIEVREHFEEFFHSRLPKDGRSQLQGE